MKIFLFQVVIFLLGKICKIFGIFSRVTTKLWNFFLSIREELEHRVENEKSKAIRKKRSLGLGKNTKVEWYHWLHPKVIYENLPILLLALIAGFFIISAEIRDFLKKLLRIGRTEEEKRDDDKEP